MRAAVTWVLLLPLLAHAAQPRSYAAKAEFKRLAPCPSTGLRRGTCPGWEVDHVQPLCSGGPDTAANMQWLSLADHRDKTRHDVRVCRYLRGVER